MKLLENLTPEELYDAVEKIISMYSEQGKKREQFYRFVSRTGIYEIRKRLGYPEEIRDRS